ncbi:MAG TPA: GAF domain-containing protein [Polyangiaceae bacterium]|nr:GAF domain-containing protein [Polyangiaceae bacterium]
MARVAVDLSPVVTSLLERPFDRPSLDRAYAAVGGHPQAYATALRCAAKKTSDSLAAAYWFAEAARTHEAMDDLGGAVALLWRAHECDRGNPLPRELLAAAMTRLAMRAGIAFTFAPEPVSASRRQIPLPKPQSVAVDTGLRPPSFGGRSRDTVPEVFGSEGDDGGDDSPLDRLADAVSTRATLPSGILRPAGLPKEAEGVDDRAEAPARATEDAELLELEELDEDDRVEQLLPPPKERSTESGVVQLSRTASGEPVLHHLYEPPAPPPEPGATLAPIPSIVIAEPATPEVAPQPDAAATRDGEGDGAGASALDSTTDAAPLPLVVVAERPGATEAEQAKDPVVVEAPSDVYAADDEAPPTLRPAGDRLVGGLFEALHGLHFLSDVRQGAAFVCRTLADKMRSASTLVHLYDINSGHFLIVCAEGNRAAALSDYATKEDDPLIALVMKGDDALLVQDPGSDPRFTRGRWALAEPKCSVLCAPITSEGRPLGLIELADPDGGGVFTEEDKNAVLYAASALSRFLDRRGLVLSDEPERSSPGPIAVVDG